MKTNDKVTIIVRSYNRQRFLKRALESIRKQTYRDYGVIVVDDGSSDGSVELLKSRDDITLVQQHRGGRTRALNRGLEVASGEFIAFLDDDDLWSPSFLASVMGVFQNGKSTGAVHTDFRCFYQGAPNKRYRLEKKLKKENLESLLHANFIPLNTIVVKKKYLKLAGEFDESLSTHEDWDMWLRLAIKGVEFRFLNENLAALRKHQDNITNNRVEMFSGALRALEKNLPAIPSRYLSTAVSTRNRLSNILGVVRVAAGEKNRGRLALFRNISRGNFPALFYLSLTLLPATALNKLISWYEQTHFRKEV